MERKPSRGNWNEEKPTEARRLYAASQVGSGQLVPGSCSGEKEAAVGIYIGRNLAIGTITTSSMDTVERKENCGHNSDSLPSVRTSYGKLNLRFIGAKIWNTISNDKKKNAKTFFQGSN